MTSLYSAIIIDADFDARLLLKTATASSSHFAKVSQAANLTEALRKLSVEEPCDVAFISYEFPQHQISDFVRRAKATAQGQDCAFILVLKTKDKESSTVAQNVILGADGFLFQPYSVEYLTEITDIASRVKRERSVTRKRAAITFFLADVMQHIDAAAELKAKNQQPGDHMRELRSRCEMLASFDKETLDMYYDLAAEQFEKAAPAIRSASITNYSGASSRLRRRFGQKT